MPGRRAELTLVVRQEEADAAGLPYDYVAGWITLRGHSALHAVGLTVAVATELAEAGLSCNVVAGFHHDHLFVPYEQIPQAVELLDALSARSVWRTVADRMRPAARTMVRMSFLRRRSAATPTGPDFDVLAMDPSDWPGNLGAGLLPAPDGSCQGVFLRYDLFGGRGPAMIIGNLPEGSPARELGEGQVPFEVAQLLAALGNDDPVHVVETEDTPVMHEDNLLIVRRIKLSEDRISCAQFDRSDGVLVTIASWDRPITDDLYALLKPLPAEMFQQR